MIYNEEKQKNLPGAELFWVGLIKHILLGYYRNTTESYYTLQNSHTLGPR